MSKDWKRQGHNGVKLNVSLQVTLMMARVMVSGMSVNNTQPTGDERASTPDSAAESQHQQLESRWTTRGLKRMNMSHLISNDTSVRQEQRDQVEQRGPFPNSSINRSNGSAVKKEEKVAVESERVGGNNKSVSCCSSSFCFGFGQRRVPQLRPADESETKGETKKRNCLLRAPASMNVKQGFG
jgi:hypothetical protein